MQRSSVRSAGFTSVNYMIWLSFLWDHMRYLSSWPNVNIRCIQGLHLYSKVMGIVLQCQKLVSKFNISIRNFAWWIIKSFDLSARKVYYILLACLASVVVLNQQSTKSAVSKWQIWWDKNVWYKRIPRLVHMMRLNLIENITAHIGN